MAGLIVAPSALVQWVGLHAASVEDERILESLEHSAVSLLERQTGRVFRLTEGHTEYYHGNGRQRLFLDQPYRSVTSVSYRTAPVGDWTAYATTDYEVFGREVWIAVPFPYAEYPSVRVVGDVGYSAPDSETASDAPEDLQLAVKHLVADAFRTRSTAVQEGGGGILLRDLRDSVRATIEAYRISKESVSA